MKRAVWVSFIALCILIGLYPIKYAISLEGGLLDTKPETVLNSDLWRIGFFSHIIFGGLALLIGWSQFSDKWRIKIPSMHKNLGKVYVISALISAFCGIFIAIHATGGIIPQIGFGLLGVLWFFTTFNAYRFILEAEIIKHQKMMIYSYALCFAAVMLRIWLPILIIPFGEFLTAYRIVAWLCWVPNLLIAHYFFVRPLLKKRP